MGVDREGEMIRAPWVLAKTGGGGECTRCGERFEMKLPLPVDVWVAAVDAFVRLHERCEAREKTDAQVPMS